MASLELLDARRDVLSGELAQVPHTPIDEVEREVLEDGGAAGRAWKLVAGINHVPIFDSVVNRVIGAPRTYWLWWYDRYAPAGRVDAVRVFRSGVGSIDDISMLRCLDVALWMHGRRLGFDAEVTS